MSLNELNATLMPHSIIHGDACFAYFNKIRGILGRRTHYPYGDTRPNLSRHTTYGKTLHVQDHGYLAG